MTTNLISKEEGLNAILAGEKIADVGICEYLGMYGVNQSLLDIGWVTSSTFFALDVSRCYDIDEVLLSLAWLGTVAEVFDKEGNINV